MHNIKISLFSSAKNPTPVSNISVAEAIEKIASNSFEKAVSDIRNEADKKKRDSLKKQLQAVTWSGTFSKRNAESLIEYSGIICHDIDGLSDEDLAQLKSLLSNDPLVYAVFISPSGNGLKVLFKVSSSAEQHLQMWRQIGDYLNESFKIVPDESCKDICRLCFLSFDDKIYINENAICVNIWEQVPEKTDSKLFIESGAATIVSALPQPTTTELEEKFLKICHQTAIKKHPTVQGHFNHYIAAFSLFANRYAIDENTAAHAIAANCGWAAPDKEDIAAIRSTYAKFTNENGIWAEDYNNKKNSGNTTTTKGVKVCSTPEDDEETEVNDEVKFWFKTTKYDRKGDPVVDVATGEVKEEYQLSYDGGITFLQNNGFFKLYEGDGYRLIRIDEQHNQVDVVMELRIEEFMLNYLKSQRNEEFNRVREIFRRSVTKYCNPRQFAGLDYRSIELKKDTRQTAYVYFSNCFFSITKDGAAQKDYNSLDGFIWKKQVNAHEYSQVDWRGCDMHLFLIRAITAQKVDDENLLEANDRKKYDAAITGIGYMLHKYKDPAVTKSLIAVDRKTRSSNDEMNGGSGKSMYGKAIGKMMNMLLIDGQNFKFDDQFAFQGVSPDTEFINFNDVNGSFNFQRLFGMITEEFTYRGLYKNSVTVPFSDSPKFFISTNHTLRGDGESVRRRQHIIEFSEYFNADHTPAKEFGRMFFNDWDNVEWSRFYSFFMHCIVQYLQVGLIDFPVENYALRKLLEWNQGAGAELNDYLNETILEQLFHNKEFEKKALFDGFMKITTIDHKFIKMNSFSSQIKLWAKINKLDINAHKNGERDRRNSADYLTFTHVPMDDKEPDVFDLAIAENELL